MRAHANCVENLPVFASLVLAAHVAFPQTELIAALRFAFFLVQFVCMLAIAGIVARGA